MPRVTPTTNRDRDPSSSPHYAQRPWSRTSPARRPRSAGRGQLSAQQQTVKIGACFEGGATSATPRPQPRASPTSARCSCATELAVAYYGYVSIIRARAMFGVRGGREMDDEAMQVLQICPLPPPPPRNRVNTHLPPSLFPVKLQAHAEAAAVMCCRGIFLFLPTRTTRGQAFRRRCSFIPSHGTKT